MGKEKEILQKLEDDVREEEPKEEPKWQPPPLSYVAYRGVIHGKKQVFNRVIPDLNGGGLKSIDFDWSIGEHRKCAYVPDRNDQALTCFDVKPNPRNRKKKKMVWHRDYDIPGASHEYRRDLANRRRRLMEVDTVPDWVVEDEHGEEI
jgi:hypothetical protein